MASEAISSSIMIIGAVLGAAVLITAILPAIFSAGDTFGTVSSSAEQKLKTDFRIVNTYTDGTVVKVWMKNVGSNRISENDLYKADVFLGIDKEVGTNSYDRYVHSSVGGSKTFSDDLEQAYWTIGETVEVTITLSADSIVDGDVVSFTFTLPNSVRRSVTFSLT
ncbi:flagellin [Methanospirillum purgamenti]|jgi:flagellar protein FlaG|uniref:Flagellin n=1 Tax=Methanospirillum hungatei TaxID=2203 RepID=A0A8F5ZGN0_METHU|nr:flagellin [Methanospirillum hungatei]QXO95934.1 flagellin [Methanospirillum hungatei]